MEVGKVIKNARNNSGYTQEDAAEDWHDEQHKREEELYYNEIDMKHIIEDEEQPRVL